MLSDAAESVSKTSKAVEVLKKIGAFADVEKAGDSKNIRRGKGGWRPGGIRESGAVEWMREWKCNVEGGRR